jgi:peptidoglycan hydrolase CwlO-like protein
MDIVIIIIAALTGSAFSVIARLAYDGIKAKRNGNNRNNNNSTKLLYGIQSSVDLLTRDVSEVEKTIDEFRKYLERSNEISIETNVHLKDLKKVIMDQTHEFRNLAIALTTAIAKVGK